MMLSRKQLQLLAHVQPDELGRDQLAALVETLAGQLDECRRREDRFRQTVDNSPNPIFTVDAQGDICGGNPAAAAFFESDKPLIGQPYLALFGEADNPELPALVQRVFRGETFAHVTITCRRQSEEHATLVSRLYPIVDEDGAIRECVFANMDITQRERSEEDLRGSEQRFRALFEHTTDAIFMIGLDKKIFAANQRAADMLGYPVEELLQLPATTFTEPGERDHADRRWDAVISGEVVPAYDRTLVHRDGTHLYVEVNVALVRDAQGRPMHIQSVIRDITQRKRSETAVYLANAYNRGLIEASLDPMMTVSPAGIITDANAATERITGLKRDSLTGTDFSSYFTVPEQAREACERTFEEGNVKDCELVIRHANGRVRPVQFNATVYKDEAGHVAGIFAAARDITERKRIEEDLRRSITQNQALLNAIPDMILRLSREGRYLDIKPAINWQPLRPPEELLNLRVGEILPAEVAPPFADSIIRALETGQLQFGEYTLHEHGEDRIYEYRMVRCSDEEVISIIRDITERRRVEEGLRDSEKRLRSVLENLPVMLDAFDKEHNVVFWNRECERVTGYSAAEIVGNPRGLEQLYPNPETRERMFADWRRQGNNYHDVEWPITRKDGEVRIISWTSVAQRVHIPDWEMWAIGMDITQRKWTEEALRESEERFRTIFQSAAIGMAVSNINGDRMGVNPSLQRMLGYSFEELYGMNLAQITHPDDLPQELALMEELRQGARNSYQLEKRCRRGDGSYFWVRLSGSIIRDEFGEPRYGLSLVEDISESKLAAQKDLELTNERERVRILADFIQDAGHEFRTPLSIINTSAYLLGRITDVTAQAAHLDKIGQQVKNITTLVDSLLMLSRLDTEQSLVRRPVHLNDVAVNAATALQTALEENRHTLQLELDDTLPPIAGDVSKLHVALVNLITNAVRYTPPGGRIVLKTRAAVDAVVVEVHDSGIGIRPDVLHRIFDRFYREDGSHSTPGFGLGLPIARKIVEQHGGTVEVESAPDRGSIFRVILPRQSA